MCLFRLRNKRVSYRNEVVWIKFPACTLVASQARNDKQKKHPPAPFKVGTMSESSPFEGGRGMFSRLVIFRLFDTIFGVSQ